MFPIISKVSILNLTMLTEVVEAVAGLVERPGVELEADNGKQEDGKEEEQGNVDQGTDGLPDRTHHHLQT